MRKACGFDPAIPFTLVAVEPSPQRRRFLIDYGKKHLPKDETTRQKAAEMTKQILKREN